MNRLTVKDSISNWTSQVREFLEDIASAARSGGWHPDFTETDVKEEPMGLGASVTYAIPVLVLRRATSNGTEQRVTLEPRHRFTLGATGRIDVYSYPALREAMLLRTSKVSNPDSLSWEELETAVGAGSWRAYSTERLPLDVDLASDSSVRQFLSDLVD